MPVAVAAFVGFVAEIGATAAALFNIGLIGVPAIVAGSVVLALTVAGVRRVSQLKDAADVARMTGQRISIRSTEAPANIVLGESQVGGVITYCNTTGDELRSLYFEIVHTAHEIDSFIGWYLDDKYIPIADVDGINGEGVASGSDDGRVTGDSNGHDLDAYLGTPVLYLRGHLGSDSQAVDSMLDSAFADIDTNHRHRGCAKSVIRCELVRGGEQRWDGRAPQSITTVVRGIKAYDPRLDSTFPGGSGSHRLATPSTWAWTDNPALLWARYRILAKPLGPGWATDRIDWQSVFDAADECDTLVAIPTSATEKRFRCDLVVDTSMEPQQVVDKILATMAGKERLFNGLWHVYAGVWQANDFALTESDLIGEIQYRKQPQSQDKERYNQVKGSFFDRDRLWKRVQYITVNNTTLRTNRDNSEVLPVVLDLDGVTREYQAQRLAMHALNQADDTGLLVFPVGYQGLNIRIGDTGTVSIAELGFVTKVFRVVGWKWVDFVGAELTLKEDSSGNYSDPAEGAYSTRTAAGDIVFGSVLPWYLLRAPVRRWTSDADGKPTGMRGTNNIADRSKLSLNSAGNMVITATAGYGFPAVPVNAAKVYALTVRHKSASASGSGLTIAMRQHSSALSAGKTHLGGGTQEPIVESANLSTAVLVNNGAMPGTSFIEETYVYTPTATTIFATLEFNTSSVDYEVESVYLTEAGSNVNILPGLIVQTDMTGLIPNAAEVLVSSQPSDGTEVLGSISYSGGGTLVDYSPITSVSWTNDTSESIDVILRQSARVQLASSDSLIGRKLAIRWSLNGGSSWSYDGTNTDNVNITAADWQPKSTQRTVTVAAGETIDLESIVVLVIPDPTTGDPADVQYRGLSLSIEVKLR